MHTDRDHADGAEAAPVALATLEEESATPETAQVKRRLATALVAAVTSLLLLGAAVLLFDRVLLSTLTVSDWGPPVVSIGTAAAILVIAARGGIHRRRPLPFAWFAATSIGTGSLVLLVMAVLWLGSEPPPTGPGGTVSIHAGDDFLFEPAVWSVPEGDVTIVYDNETNTGHTLTIEGMEDDLHLRVTSAGEVVTGMIRLRPGTYTVYCDIRGHRDLGMEGTLTVTRAPHPEPDRPGP